MPQPEEITGTLVSVRWPVEDSDFVIGELQPDGTTKRTERIKIVGNCDPPSFELKTIGKGLHSRTVQSPVDSDESSFQFVLTQQCRYQFYGFRSNDPKWGPQFAFKSFIPVRPHTQAGVVKYLQQCDGIGIAIARALWNKFRGDAVRCLREHPEIASSAVSGLTLAKATVAAEKLATLEKLEDCSIELMGLLDGRGMPKAVAMKALKKWGNLAVDFIQHNPFLLMSFRGCGFLKCFAMYKDLGLPLQKMKVQVLCAWYSIASDSSGSTWHTREHAEAFVRGKIGGVSVEFDKAISVGMRHGIIAVRETCRPCNGFGYRDEPDLFFGDTMERIACHTCGGDGTSEIADENQMWVTDGRRSAAESSLARKVAEMMQWRGDWPDIDGREFDRLSDHQREQLRLSTSGSIGMISGGPGTGKAQPFDAKVLTPTGWTTMGEIKVGDYVIGKNGKKSLVVGEYQQGIKDVYSVVFSDGSTTQCCEDHLWETTTRNQRKRLPHRPTVKTLREIESTICRTDGRPNHAIPMVDPVEFEELSIPVPPYLLGVLLGDGGLTQKSIRLSNPDLEIIDRVSRELEQFDCQLKSVREGGIDWRITRKLEFGKYNKLRKKLNELGLIGKTSLEKYIPDLYKFSRSSTRIGLLQGLLDTDGYCDGFNIEYTTSSPLLCRDVTFLCQSLGGHVSVSKKTPFYKHCGEVKAGSISYRMLLKLPPEIKPFFLSRKLAKYKPKTKYKPTRRIVSINLVGKKECKCISIQSDDGLYVTDDFIVTHNTTTTMALVDAVMRKHGRHEIAVAAPTNKAAHRCREILHGSGLEVQTSSIHSLLGVESADDGWSFHHGPNNPLPYRVVIIDEVSMPSTSLMASLLSSIAKGTMVLFVGDINQLPPIDHGAPARDMLAAGIPQGHLTETWRNSGSIVEACKAIRLGMPIHFDQRIDLTAESPRNLQLIQGGGAMSQKQLMAAIRELRSDPTVDPIDDVQVMVAVNKRSPVCRETLNSLLADELNPDGQRIKGNPFRVGDKVVKRVRSGLFKMLAGDSSRVNSEGQAFISNGEFGRVREVKPKSIIVEFTAPRRIVQMPISQIRENSSKAVESNNANGDNGGDGGSGGDIQLGYAATVHAMQGSECEIALICWDEYPGASGPHGVCSREWATTAISRAKRYAMTFGKPQTVRAICAKESLSKRKTFLQQDIERYRRELGQ